MSTTTLQPCLEDPRTLWEERVCLEPVSKDLRGELKLLDRERQECDEPRCLTLKTDHLLRVDLRSHEPCDSKLGQLLDGTLLVRRLITALADGTGQGRGLHAGDFRWFGDGFRIEGRLAGMTNVGTHREPAFRDCQQCHDPGYMEGRLCGRVVRAKEEHLVGCQVTAAYRLRFDPSEGFEDSGVEGTLEGLVVCRCGGGACVELSTFPQGSHANPWTVPGYTFDVRDHTGTPTPTVDVQSMGGAEVGVNVSYETKIELATPTTSGLDITLVHYASPAVVTAFDSSGAVVDSATMVISGTPETLHLSGAIATLVVAAPNNETLILEICAG